MRQLLTGESKGTLRLILTMPVIYSLIIPLVLLDLWTQLYQAICFPVYRIKHVYRRDYAIFDRGRLPYLNWLERLDCLYCSYANGVVAYAREVAGRTEQFFCPIKHAAPHRWAHRHVRRFRDYGDAEGYRKGLPELREELRSGRWT